MSVVAKRLDGLRCHFVCSAGWPMPLGMEVGLGPTMGTQLPRKKAQPHPILGPCLLWPINGWMDQGTTYYGVYVGLNIGPGDVVLDGVAAPHFQKGHSPQSSVHVYCGQTAGWIKTSLGTGVDLGPGCVRRGPSCPAKGAPQPPPSFRLMSIVATVAHLSYC